MSTYSAKLASSVATTGDLVEIVPTGATYPTGAITLLDADGDGVWNTVVADTNANQNNFDIYVNGTILTQSEALSRWYGNKATKDHIDASNPHTGSASSTDLTTHTGDTTNPHNVTVDQVEAASSVTLAVIDDTAGSGDTEETWSADKLRDDEVGDRSWTSNALDAGIITDNNLTDAINNLATTVIGLDPDGTGVGTVTAIAGTEYAVKAVTTEGGTTSVLITCANVTAWDTLKFHCAGNATTTGQFELYIDDSLEASVPIQTTAYQDVVGTYDLTSTTGNIKIELKVTDVALVGVQTINAKLSSVVLER